MVAQAGMPDFRQLFDAMHELYVVVDRDLRIVYANPAYLDAVKRGLKELSGQPILDVFSEGAERLAEARGAWEGALAGRETRLENLAYDVARKPGSRRSQGQEYWTCVHTPIFDDAGAVRYVLQHAKVVTDRVRTEERQRMMSAELNHRVRNILTIVNTVARLTARQTLTIEEFLAAFGARINAMAHTHTALSSGAWTGVTMRELVEAGVEPFRKRSGRGLRLDGDLIELRHGAAQTFSMIVHELASNAGKYGAFAAPEGEVLVRWRLADAPGAAPDEGRRFTFEWIESGLTLKERPKEMGFGATVLTNLAASQFEAQTEYSIGPDGVYYRIAMDDSNLVMK